LQPIARSTATMSRWPTCACWRCRRAEVAAGAVVRWGSDRSCCFAKPDWYCCRGAGESIRAAELWGFPPNSVVSRHNRRLFHRLNAPDPAAGASSAAPAVEKPSPLDRRQRGVLACPTGAASRQEGSSGLTSHGETRPCRTGFAALTLVQCS
jgi:hypothetical protein